MLADFEGYRVLLLQGPNGPLFSRMGRALRDAGAEVFKINLNAADAVFYSGPGTRAFRGTFEQWPGYLEATLRDEQIDVVFLFGDCRPHHRVAREICQRLKVELIALDEGYLRPDYITLERGGVNANSTMPTGSEHFLDAPTEVPSPLSVKHAFAWSVFWTILNSLFVTLGAFRYPNYRHHRDVQTWRQMWLWARGFWRRIRYAEAEAPLLPKLCGEWSGAYFLVGLQVFNDSQVSNSRFKDVSEFICEVVASFAAHADIKDRLVVKHHPADRPYRDYAALLDELARKHGLEQRLLYVHDLHLPALLRHARGTVVINSTVGLSSLFHRTPVKALCDAVYVRMGLSAKVPLEAFWRAPPPVDFELYRQAHRWLVHNCQANGSVWCKLRADNASGMLWPINLRPQSPPRARSSTASASRSR